MFFVYENVLTASATLALAVSGSATAKAASGAATMSLADIRIEHLRVRLSAPSIRRHGRGDASPQALSWMDLR
jgi:hypothetical protein